MKKTKKTTKRKTTKKKVHKEPKKNNSFLKLWLPIIIIIVAVIAITTNMPKQSSDVIAKINGQPIYMENFLEKKAQVPQGFEEFYTNELVLNQTFVEAVLLQLAEENGITVTTDEAKAIIEENMQLKGVSKEDLMQQLEDSGTTFEEFLELGVRQLTIIRALEIALPIESIEISDEEVQALYENLALENQTIEDVREQLVETIKGQKYQVEVTELVEDLISKSDIEILVDLSTI